MLNINSNRKKQYARTIVNFLSHAATPNVQSVLAIIIAVCAFCEQQKVNEINNELSLAVDSANYAINAFQIHPELKIINDKSKDSITFDIKVPKELAIPDWVTQSHFVISKIDSPYYFIEPKRGYRLDLSDTTVKVNMDLNIKAVFKITNVGNATAIIKFIGYTDLFSSEPILRNIVLNSYLQNDSSLVGYFPEYFNNEISPNDTREIAINYKIQNFINGDFEIHCIIIYANRIDQYYDSYFWIRYTAIPFRWKPEYFIMKTDSGIGKYSRLASVKTSDKLIDRNVLNQSHKFYSKSKKKELIDYIQLILNNQY